jgi:tetratricopeptide (TPR) repeat protein
MRLAVVISPWDPRSSEGGNWSDAVAWLGASLARLGFDMAVVGGTDAGGAELARALEGMTPEDSVLVHVSGTLARRGVLRLVDGRWLPLRTIGEALAAHARGDVSIVAELVHEDDAEDALVAADHVASAVSAIGARERGYGMVVAVRPSGTQVEAIGFTRVLLEAAVAAAERRENAQLSAVYQAVRAMPDSVALAQSFTLVRGRVELELAPPAPPPADLDALVEAATAVEDWARAAQLRRERLQTIASPRQRVKELVALARIQQQHLADRDGALASLEEARTLEPRRASVLQALSRGYEMAGRWASAMEATGALADVTPMPVDRAALRYAQARLALDQLEDEERALTLLEQTLEEDPAHAEARSTLTRLRSSLTPPEPMPVPKEESIAAPPPQQDQAEADELDPAVHLRAFGQHRREGRADAAFLSALALEELGASYPDLQAFIDQTRSVTAIRAKGTLDAAAWELLRPYGMDEVLTALFAAVSRAGATARVEQLEARGRLVALDPSSRLEDSSTASVVRSFQWAARVLGVRCPGLFAIAEVPGEIAAVRAPEPSTAVGPSIVSGRSAKDLAFLAGRHLTYYRPEAQVLVYFPTRDELTRLLLAAVRLTKPEEEAGDDASRAVAALATRLDRHISDEDRNGLRRAVWELEVRGGKFSLGAFTRNVELMGARAGLLLCGDLATATAIVSTEVRSIAGLSLEAKRRDLVAFNVSDEHVTLRERFAAGASGTADSVRPPPGAPRDAVYTP